jgi:hypothetical protein
VRFAEKFRFRPAMKRRLDESLALGAPHEASARDPSRKPGKPIEGQVAAEIPRKTFSHPPLRFTKPNSADEICDDKERSDERGRRDGDNNGSFVHARRPSECCERVSSTQSGP